MLTTIASLDPTSLLLFGIFTVYMAGEVALAWIKRKKD